MCIVNAAYQTLRVARTIKQRIDLLPLLAHPSLPLLPSLSSSFSSPPPHRSSRKGSLGVEHGDPGKAEEGSPGPPGPEWRGPLPCRPSWCGEPGAPQAGSAGIQVCGLPCAPTSPPEVPESGTALQGRGPCGEGPGGAAPAMGDWGGSACGTPAPPTRIKVLRCLVSPSIKLILSEV